MIHYCIRESITQIELIRQDVEEEKKHVMSGHYISRCFASRLSSDA